MLLLRKLLIGVALAAIGVSVAASAATGRSRQESVSSSLLLPGVNFTHEVDFTSRGPIVLDVVTAPKPDGKLYSLSPALSNDQLRGKESLTRIESPSPPARRPAIDGDYFDSTGAPSGMLMQNDVLESAPAAGRSSLGIAADGTLTTGRVSSSGLWQGNGLRRPLLLNSPAATGNFSLYTPVYGTATPGSPGVVEAVIGTLPRPSSTAARRHRDAADDHGADADPARRRGARRARRAVDGPAQSRGAGRAAGRGLLSLSPDWSSLASAIGGGPLLVKNGKPIFQAGEAFASRELNSRQARGAIGQLSDGRFVLVSVEGTKPAYSSGCRTTSSPSSSPARGDDRLRARRRLRFGARVRREDAHAAVGGLTPKVSDALVLPYSGVYAAPPSTVGALAERRRRR